MKQFIGGIFTGAALTVAALYLLNQPEPEPQVALSAHDSEGQPISMGLAIQRALRDAIYLINDTHERISKVSQSGASHAIEADAFAHHLIQGVKSGSITAIVRLTSSSTPVSGFTLFNEFVAKAREQVSVSVEAMKVFHEHARAAIDKAVTDRKFAEITSNFG